MCMTCSGSKTQAEHDLYTEWLGHGQREEFHQKHPQGNSTMQYWHKARRLEIEPRLRAMREANRNLPDLSHCQN